MTENNLCTDPETGALLHAYELAALSTEDTERFEIHLLQCRHCFNEVHTFSERADLLRANATVKEEVARTVSESKLKRRVNCWNFSGPKDPLSSNRPS